MYHKRYPFVWNLSDAVSLTHHMSDAVSHRSGEVNFHTWTLKIFNLKSPFLKLKTSLNHHKPDIVFHGSCSENCLASMKPGPGAPRSLSARWARLIHKVQEELRSLWWWRHHYLVLHDDTIRMCIYIYIMDMCVYTWVYMEYSGIYALMEYDGDMV